MQRQRQLNFHKPSTASAHTPSRFSLHPQKLPLTHSPTLTRFHCHCLNWIRVSDMRYDAGQHEIRIACVYEHVSDFHLLKIVHFRRVPHHKNHHAGWKWKCSPDAKLDYSFFLAASALLYTYCHLELWVCLTSSLTMPWLWVFFLSFERALMMVIVSQGMEDGLCHDWMVMMMMINSWMMCELLWDWVRQMWMCGDCFRRCELLRCQGNSVLLWQRGSWRREKLCWSRKCVGLSHGYQWRLRHRAGG